MAAFRYPVALDGKLAAGRVDLNNLYANGI
jgi:hypothetical protein